MHNEVNIPSKKGKCSILHKRCPFFSAEQTVRRWTPLGGLVLHRPQSDLGWLRSLTNHQHPWLARNVLSGQRNVDFKIECVHYFYSLLCTPLGQCVICYRDEMTIKKTVLIQQCWNYLLRSQVQNKVNDHRTLGVRVTIYLWYGLGSSILDSSHHILGSYCNNGEIAPIDTGHVNTVPTHWLENMDGCNASLCTTSYLWQRAL